MKNGKMSSKPNEFFILSFYFLIKPKSPASVYDSKKCPSNLIAPLIKIVIEEIRKACKKQPVNCGFNPTDNAYEPLKLMQTVMAKTNEVCLRYLDNSMLYSLPSPGTPYCITSVSAVKNTRKRMEDRHVVIHDLNTMFNIQEASPSSYYAVFDGHAGHDAASYSSAHLHQYLAESKYFVTNPEQALLDAFCKTDALFLDKCKVENLTSGTTAVVALLRPKENTLYIAWAGDSQALLVNQGRVLQVVNPHKPSRQDERERIEKQGGCVMLWGIWRVNGQLAVSRAIGDADYKPYVIAIPEIREISLDGGEDFLIIACDGLWDFLSEDRAARAVYHLITENPDDTDRVSQHLVRLAKELGSSDNISVIVVFLREPSKVAAEAHWANRNLNPVTMDASLDNVNNPFAISNGATTDNIISQKSDGLLLNLTDNFKQNGSELSPTSDYYEKEKSNGKRSASEFDDDDDFGPETDVDAVDDALSPIETTKGFGDAFSNNNPFDEGVYNPFMEHQEKAALELERNMQKQDSGEFEEPRMAREETPTPPVDVVHDVRGLVENAAESDSEDEWNYIKGDEANKENISPVPEPKVAEIPEEDDDNMSQLNPNAAEFVPVSPTRSIPSPACRTLINDQVISQSPKRHVNELDINLPNPSDFEKEVKSRPSEVDSYSNGHNGDSDRNITPTDLMEDILNGKNIDEIPEFQPGSTPKKVLPSDEFHFGPNAAPFTPVKLLDQSEAALSTNANYGDESIATLGTSFNESVATEGVVTDLNIINKESDPMSMSFYADKGDSNPFDLNEVQILPENLDEFLKQSDNEPFNDTISDLPEHHPLGEQVKPSGLTLNNDDVLKITDLDKQSYDDEKELASPLEPENDILEYEQHFSEKESLEGVEEIDFSKTPEPTHENLLGGEFCHVSEKSRPLGEIPSDVEIISSIQTNELRTPEPIDSSEGRYSSKEDLSAATVSPVLKDVPRDVEVISPEIMQRISHPSKPEDDEKEIDRPVENDASEVSLSPEQTEVADMLKQATEVSDLLGELEPSEVPAEDSDELKQAEATEVGNLLRQLDSIEVATGDVDMLKEEEDTEVSNLLGQLEAIEIPIESSDMVKQVVGNLIGQLEAIEVDYLLKHSEANEDKLVNSETTEVSVEKLNLAKASDMFEQLKDDKVQNLLDEPEATEVDVLKTTNANDFSHFLEQQESTGVTDVLQQSVVTEDNLDLPKQPEAVAFNDSQVEDTLIAVSKSPVAEVDNLEVHKSLKESLIDISKSPETEINNFEHESLIPEAEVDIVVHESSLPVCEVELHASTVSVSEVPASKSPAIELFESKSPVHDITESVCDLSESQSPYPDEVVGGQTDTGDLESPLSPDFTKPELIAQAQVHFEELCQPAEDVQAPESPQEDVTSSVRDDDMPSPVLSSVPDVEDSFVADQSTVCAINEDITKVVQEAVVSLSTSSQEPEVSTPKSIADTESVATTDVNSFLERSLPPDVASPLSTTEDEMEKYVYSDHPLYKCVFPLPPQPTSEEIDIKTENISPEFAEQTIVTPSEESKQDEIPAVPLLVLPVEEPASEEKKESKELVNEVTAVGVVAAVATGVAVAAVASAPKVGDKKKPTGSPAKKLSVKSATTSKSAPKLSPAPKTPSRPSSSPRVAPPKPGVAKAPTTTAPPKSTVSKLLAKPKSTLPPKPAEKKPVASGDVKSAVKTTLSSRRITSETTATRTPGTTKSATATSKTSPTKTAPSRLSASSRPAASAPKTTTRTATTTTTSSTAKARPTTLTSRPRASTSPSKGTTSTTRMTLTKTSPRTTTAPPKPKLPTSAVPPKPRVPLTKSLGRTPDTEKQNKESANKLTASRSVTAAKTTASATSRTTSTNVRRVESKVSATRTIQSKTTTTTTKSTTGKKPVEVIRHASSKSVTKIEKPKESGVSLIVTEEVTVNNISSTINDEPQLVKDNSPMDNKLFTETTLIQTNTAD